MVGGRYTRHGDSQSDGSNLGGVQEVGTEETNWDEEVEQEDEQHTDDLGGQIRSWKGCGHSQTSHASRHADTAEHEDSSASEPVNCEEGDEAAQELPGQAAARKNTRSLGAERKTLLENDGRVHRDEVRTAHLLEELENDAEQETVKKLVLAHLEHIGEGSSRYRSLLEGYLNIVEFRGNLRSVFRQTAKSGEGISGVSTAALEHQPARRFWQEKDSRHQDEGEEAGDGDWCTPCDWTGLELVEAKVDPRLEDVSKRDEATVKDDVLTTVLGVGTFGLPCWNGTTEHTDTSSKNEASNDQLWQLERGSLEDFSDEG